jgi:hypothetical protein
MFTENSVKTCDFFLGWGIWFLNVFGDRPIKWPIAKEKKPLKTCMLWNA